MHVGWFCFAVWVLTMVVSNHLMYIQYFFSGIWFDMHALVRRAKKGKWDMSACL